MSRSTPMRIGLSRHKWLSTFPHYDASLLLLVVPLIFMVALARRKAVKSRKLKMSKSKKQKLRRYTRSNPAPVV